VKYRVAFVVIPLGACSAALAGCFSLGVSLGLTDPAPPPEPPAGSPPGAADPRAQSSAAPTEEAPQTVCEVGELAHCTGLCNEGDALSCNNLGATYELGQSVDVDLQRALSLYERACAGGADAGCQNATRLKAPPAASASPAAGW
jgi:TPR repeat protein